MSQKEEVIRALYAARARHDHEALRPLVTEDVVFHEPGAESYSGDYAGPDALIDHFDRLLEQTEGIFTLNFVPERTGCDRLPRGRACVVHV